MENEDVSDFLKAFPFQPWPIQLSLMGSLYDVIESRKVGIFESPTGTGKSLSLLCGCLVWLREHQDRLIAESAAREFEEEHNSASVPGEPPWISEHREKLKEEMVRDSLEKFRSWRSNREKTVSGLAPYIVKRKIPAHKHESAEAAYDKDKIQENAYNGPKIYFCMRTHSQMSQFAKEASKVKIDKVFGVCIGSRINMCINDKVKNYKNVDVINMKCLDAVKNHACAYNKADTLREEFAARIHTEIKDIEDVVEMGSKMKVCPYYGSREAIKNSEIVILTYNSILHKPTRDSLGISLKDNIVVIDEAHNIINALSSINSIEITQSSLEHLNTCVLEYINKYGSKHSGENILHIRRLLIVLKTILKYIQHSGEYEVFSKTPQEFLSCLNMDNINLLEISTFVKSTSLDVKLEGISKRLCSNQEENTKSAFGAISNLRGLFDLLLNPCNEGSIIISRGGFEKDKQGIKYIILHPERAFRDVIKESRSVILAGGTMEPVSDIMHQILCSVPESDIVKFSCNHIVPPTSITTIVLSSGPTNVGIKLNHENQSDFQTMDEIGRIVMNFSIVVKGGIIVFFPSYAYLFKVKERWYATQLIASLNKIKRVFIESKDSKDSEKMLKQYSECIFSSRGSSTKDKFNGAILLAVVGGKVSEGINFSDDLGRLVVVVGLPFANIKSLELQLKIKYIKEHIEPILNNKIISTQYYENLCLKAVNQSIGRVIRHIGDYAAIVLLDERFNKENIKAKLPNWIKESGIKICPSFSKALVNLSEFFKRFPNEVSEPK